MEPSSRPILSMFQPPEMSRLVTVNGRLISLNASTTLVDTVINVPLPRKT